MINKKIRMYVQGTFSLRKFCLNKGGTLCEKLFIFRNLRHKRKWETFTVRCLLSFSNESQLVTILQVLWCWVRTVVWNWHFETLLRLSIWHFKNIFNRKICINIINNIYIHLENMDLLVFKFKLTTRYG